MKIPRAIKIKVLRGWLSGLSRDRIANENKIGCGSVSGIINQIRTSIVDLDLLREVSTEIRKKGLSLSQMAASIRLRRKLEKIHMTEEMLENILEHIGIHCFQEGIGIEQFLVHADEVIGLTENLGAHLCEIPAIIEKSKLEVEKLDEQILSMYEEINRLVAKYQITAKDLEEYRITRPLADRIKQLEHDLEDRDRLINLLTQNSNRKVKSYGQKDIAIGLRTSFP